MATLKHHARAGLRFVAVPDTVGEDAAGAMDPPVQHVRRLAQVDLAAQLSGLQLAGFSRRGAKGEGRARQSHSSKHVNQAELSVQQRGLRLSGQRTCVGSNVQFDSACHLRTFWTMKRYALYLQQHP